MINANLLTSKSDLIGIMASTLCFLHCLATPLLFVVYASSTVMPEVHPWWWGMLDVVFLAISFFAIYWSTQNTSKTWVKYAFWFTWVLLSLIVMNEKLGFWHLLDSIIYPPTLGLVLLHFYNRRHCQCEDESCCIDN